MSLLPATEFPGSRSWGYNPANPFALESDYGGPVAFKEMVKKAHEPGHRGGARRGVQPLRARRP
ncbi:hypothetical protein ACFQT0_13150 [Hymenobacter humi]|uniref:Uncharacterized protein n=1 Tax=Hymenobacter humi TaxID=1411620 RepID=A0ABW2U5M2_9BACT